MENLIFSILNIIIFIILYFIYSSIKKMPETIQNGFLEKYKADLAVQINKKDKEFSEIQSYKVKMIIELLEYFNEFLSDPKKIEDISKNQKKSKEFNNKMTNLGLHLLLFASDQTVKKYNHWRDYGKKETSDKYRTLILFSEFVILLRKDIGHHDTSLEPIDHLETFLKEDKETLLKLFN